jgi:diguanylate cyclase (GGDEF)-like protein/PAS domain S-box-containing protein
MVNSSPSAESPTSKTVAGAGTPDDGADEAFGRLTRLASLALRTPLAAIALIDHGRLLVRGHVGMPEPWANDGTVALPHAIFRHTLATSKPFVVEDTTRHPLMRDMVLSDEWRQAAYCGVPIVLDGRRVVGVIFVMESRPRQWAQREIAFLQDLANSAATEIEKRLGIPAAAESPRPMKLNITAPASEGVLLLDSEWHIRSINARATAILGRAESELSGRSLLAVFPSLVGSLFHHEYVRAFSEQSPIELEAWCGTLGLWMESRAYPVEDGLAVHLRDVSARRNAEEALRQSEARYRSVFQESHDPILFTAADGTIIECNRAALHSFGYSRDELFRMQLGELLVDEDVEAFQEQTDSNGSVADHDTKLRAKGDEPRPVRLTLSARRAADGDIVGWQATIRPAPPAIDAGAGGDAFRDSLTGLANRAVFLDRLDRLFLMAQRRDGYRFAILFIDLDRFKIVNDTLGHLAGDELLTTVARRLESCLRQEDSVARLGGDEFGILLDSVEDVRDSTRVAERINQELALPIRIGPREVAASASIGIAFSDQSHNRADQVLADADAAMYRAKAGGGARYEVFDTEMHLRAIAQLQLEADLRRAVRNNEFVIHYQPILTLESGEIAGFEALLRWLHPERGLLHPIEFVDVADQTGLANDMGWMVLEHASNLAQTWLDRAPGLTLDLGISVNVTPRQIEDVELIPRIDELLERSGLPAGMLRLELTESALMNEVESLQEALGELRQRGVEIGLDNFGTGFSSLRYMQRLQIATLKIDRTFLRSIDRATNHRAVIESALGIGRALGIDVIAAGVESLDQLTELRRLGLQYAQGYLLCEPLDAESATDLMLERAQV